MVWEAKDTRNVFKVAGHAAKAYGSIQEVMATIEGARSAVQINASNAMARMGDTEQVHKAMNDNIRILTRGSKRAGGRLRAAAANSNIVMQGSPLMAMEELQQQGWRDIMAVHEKAKFRVAGIGKEIDMGYLQAISGLKAAEKAAEAEMVKGVASIAGLWMGK